MTIVLLVAIFLHTIEYRVMLHVSSQFWPFAVILN